MPKKAPAPSLELDLSAKRTTNLAVLQKLNPNVLEIIGDATHVALYSFEAAAAKWERMGIEGACFVTRCAQSPFYNLFVLNKMGDEDFVIDIKTIINIKLQPPYVMLRYSGTSATCIVGLWFHDDDERAAMKDLVSRAMQSSAASAGGNGASSGGGGGGIQALKALLGAGGQATPPPPLPADKPTGANLLAMLKAPESAGRTVSAPNGSVRGEASSSSSKGGGGSNSSSSSSGGGVGSKGKSSGANGELPSKDDSASAASAAVSGGGMLLPGHGRELQPYFCEDGSVREGSELWGFVGGAGAVQGELLTDREISSRRAASEGDLGTGGGSGNGNGGGNGETILLASKLKNLLKAPPTPTPAPAPTLSPSPVIVGRQLSVSALLPGLAAKMPAAVAAPVSACAAPAPAPASFAATLPAAASPAPAAGKLLSPSDLTGLKKSYTAAK